MPPIVDWAARMKEMSAFVGLTQADLDLVKETGPLILKHAQGLVDAVYEHLLKFPAARRFFLTEDGAVDHPRLERRKHTLIRWLRNSVDFPVEEEFPVYLLTVAIAHSHPPAHRAHLGPVPSRYMIGTISFAQTALAQLFRQEMADPDRAMRAGDAWNRLLMVQLDVLLASYTGDIAPGG